LEQELDQHGLQTTAHQSGVDETETRFHDLEIFSWEQQWFSIFCDIFGHVVQIFMRWPY
jgi:hypothetical protein